MEYFLCNEPQIREELNAEGDGNMDEAEKSSRF